MEVLNDKDKINILQNLWSPEINFNFPTTKFGFKMRKFNYTWLDTYKWLVYSKSDDGAYCKYCFIFAPHQVGKYSLQNTGQLVNSPYKNWKNALEHFRAHQYSHYHQSATTKADNFLAIQSGKLQSIENQVDTARAQQIRENQRKLAPIIKTVILCGRQCLPLRGHKDYGEFNISVEPEENEGNFRALLRARIESGDSSLKLHFETCGRNATYISWRIQNEIIQACDIIIQKKITAEVNQAKCFTILADETADISSVEQLSLCVRYLKEYPLNTYKICEHFLRFVPVSSTSGEALANEIVKGLQQCNIDISYLRGQGYDGAANMSGVFKGVQTLISKQYKTALYVHCVSHCLNLALSNSSEVQAIRNCVGTIEKVYVFFNTPKRQLVLQKHVEALLPESNSNRLKQLCPTRWVQRHDAVMIMVQLLKPVLSSLQEISSWIDKDSSTGACILISALGQSSFIISLLCLEKLLGFTLPLSKILQNKDIDLAFAISNIKDVIASIQILRENADDEFCKIFDEAKQIAEIFDTEIQMPRLTTKQMHRSNIPNESCIKYYQISIFLPWVDSFLSNLNDRFTKHEAILSNLMVLLPNGNPVNQKQIKDFHNLVSFYRQDIQELSKNVLEAELRLWYQKFIQPSKASIDRIDPPSIPKSALNAINMMNVDAYPNIFILLKIFSTLPVSTATAERTFSTLRRLKSYLRNTMGENRLNGLANLNIHREVHIDTNEVLSILKERGPRRLDFVL